VVGGALSSDGGGTCGNGDVAPAAQARRIWATLVCDCQPAGVCCFGACDLGRLEAAGAVTSEAVLAYDEEALRGLGLSRQKARYARALAEAQIDYAALRGATDAEVVRVLTAVSGIGVWTAEIYAMFSLWRADVFAPGDLALQEGARVLYGLEARPKDKALREMAQAWSPWRSVAARTLWAYYHVVKSREGIA